MYLAHFGLTHYPFERDLQPDELFASITLREAHARLNHLIELRWGATIILAGRTTIMMAGGEESKAA